MVAEAKLGLVVAGVAVAGRQQVVHDEEARAGDELLVEGRQVVARVVVVVAAQTAQLALQHAQRRHLHTHRLIAVNQSINHSRFKQQPQVVTE